MKKFGNEFKVGIFFVLSLAGLTYLFLSTGKVHLSQKGYTIYAVFDDVSGLQKNSPVMVNGLEVGRVQEISLYNDEGQSKIKLNLLIKPDTKIWDECVISIKTLGLMGEKYVHIKSIQGKNLIKPGAIIIGKTPADMDVLFSEAQTLSQSINQLTHTLNDTVQENRDSLSKSISNIAEISQQIKLTLKDNGESLNNIIANLENTSKNFEEFSQDLKRHPWKLLYRPREKK